MRDSEKSILGLLRDIKAETKTLLREEAQLAKTEMSEKIGAYGKDSITVAVGGIVAYAGLIVFLGGLGCLIAFLFEKLDINPLLAGFAGLGIVGLLVIIIGAIFLLIGMKGISNRSPKPEKTLETLDHLRGKEHPAQPEPAPEEEEEKKTSGEAKETVLATQNRIAASMDELSNRMTFTHMKRKATEGLKAHPYRWGTVAAGIGLAGSVWLRHKLRSRELNEQRWANQ